MKMFNMNHTCGHTEVCPVPLAMIEPTPTEVARLIELEPCLACKYPEVSTTRVLPAMRARTERLRDRAEGIRAKLLPEVELSLHGQRASLAWNKAHVPSDPICGEMEVHPALLV